MIILSDVKKEKNIQGGVRLSCEIEVDGKKNTVWYEVEEEYGEYLSDDRCDAFFVAALPWALKYGHDIVLSANVTQELYNKVVSLLVPILVKKCDGYKKEITIQKDSCSNGLSSVGCGSAVGMGISCGVDSFYTYYYAKENCTQDYQITHLTYFNVGSHRDEFHGEEAQALFTARQINSKAFAKEEGKKFVIVNSNIGDVFAMPHIESHSFRNVSAVLVLQKLFRVYYYSAGVSWEDFEFTSAPAHYDIYLLSMLSIANCSFYSIGGESSRLDKVKRITEYSATHEHLDVCLSQANNCSSCEKCIRTLLSLWVLEKENLYRNVFDLEMFYSNLEQYILYAMHRAENENEYVEIINAAKERGLITIKHRLHYFIRRCKNMLKKSI